jgi:hypothetical protein
MSVSAILSKELTVLVHHNVSFMLIMLNIFVPPLLLTLLSQSSSKYLKTVPTSKKTLYFSVNKDQVANV